MVFSKPKKKQCEGREAQSSHFRLSTRPGVLQLQRGQRNEQSKKSKRKNLELAMIEGQQDDAKHVLGSVDLAEKSVELGNHSFGVRC